MGIILQSNYLISEPVFDKHNNIRSFLLEDHLHHWLKRLKSDQNDYQILYVFKRLYSRLQSMVIFGNFFNYRLNQEYSVFLSKYDPGIIRILIYYIENISRNLSWQNKDHIDIKISNYCSSTRLSVEHINWLYIYCCLWKNDKV